MTEPVPVPAPAIHCYSDYIYSYDPLNDYDYTCDYECEYEYCLWQLAQCGVNSHFPRYLYDSNNYDDYDSNSDSNYNYDHDHDHDHDHYCDHIIVIDMDPYDEVFMILL